MKRFMDDDFLLNTFTAKKLFHEFCENMPICDYHCHLNAKEIYENKPFYDISDLWFKDDHYKWRAMRSFGVSEDYCTGNKSGREKFNKYANTIQYAIGNPLYHWSHLELKRYFNIDTELCLKNADDIYDRANQVMVSGEFKPQNIIKYSKVKVICTTDDPVDDLKYHKLLKQQDFDCKVLPTFRADKSLQIEKNSFSDYIKELELSSGVKINTFKDVIKALYNRADYFNSVGCRISDQSFAYVPYVCVSDEKIETIFSRRMNGESISEKEADSYKTKLFLALAEKYYELGWAMEIHIGAMRNNNTFMYNKKGDDIGFDSIGDANISCSLSRFLDALDVKRKLPKTILFNLNSKDNCVIGSMIGNFQSDEVQSKIQFGPAWWFLDTIDGMKEQMKTLANLGILGKFIGMETDSRSFTSYTRHEYFRRIMCSLIGEWVENGMYSNDERMLKEIVQGIAFNNAMEYFGFNSGGKL